MTQQPRSPQPGAQHPERYPVAPGPKYSHYGEQPGWIYNPYADKYEPDPKTAKAWGEEVGLIEPEKKPPGLGEQLMPVAGVAGAIYGAKKIGEGLMDGGIGKVGENIGSAYQDIVGSANDLWTKVTGPGEAATAAAPQTAAAAPVATQAATAAAPAQAPGMMGAASTAQPVATAAENAAFNADAMAAGGGGTPPAGNPGMFGMGPVATGALGAAALGAGTYGMINAYESGDPMGGALSGAGAGMGASMLSGALGAGYLGPWGLVGGAVVGAAAGLLGGHKSTDEYRKERWGDVISNAAAPNDAEAASHFYQLAEEGSKNQTFQAGPLAGRKWKWEEVKGLAKGEDMWGANGFFEAFPDWMSGYNEDQRRAIAQAALDHDLLSSDKGSIIFSGKKGHKDRIQAIAKEVKEGSYVPPISEEDREKGRQEYAASIGVEYTPLSITAASNASAPPQPGAQQAPAGQENPGMMRSRTLSPGIDLEGNRISY